MESLAPISSFFPHLTARKILEAYDPEIVCVIDSSGAKESPIAQGLFNLELLAELAPAYPLYENVQVLNGISSNASKGTIDAGVFEQAHNAGLNCDDILLAVLCGKAQESSGFALERTTEDWLEFITKMKDPSASKLLLSRFTQGKADPVLCVFDFLTIAEALDEAALFDVAHSALKFAAWSQTQHGFFVKVFLTTQQRNWILENKEAHNLWRTTSRYDTSPPSEAPKVDFRKYQVSAFPVINPDFGNILQS